MHDFENYRLLYEERHKTLSTLINKLIEKTNTNDIQIARLEVKSGIMGLIGGAIPAAIILAWYLIQS